MEKKAFVTKEQIEEIVKTYPTPFHIYDEKGIRENARALKEAFSWNKGYKEYFAVKATPNPFLIDILRDYGCGCDCSSMTELMLSNAMGVDGKDIMFSSNDTPAEEFAYAAKIGATINLDDFTHIDFLEKTIGYLPKTLSCRYNPGGYFSISNNIMDNPGDAKYGFTTEQMFEGFRVDYRKEVYPDYPEQLFVTRESDTGKYGADCCILSYQDNDKVRTTFCGVNFADITNDGLTQKAVKTEYRPRASVTSRDPDFVIFADALATEMELGQKPPARLAVSFGTPRRGPTKPSASQPGRTHVAAATVTDEHQYT